MIPGEYLRDQHAVALKARIHIHQSDEAADQQPGADDEDQGDGNLGDDETGAEPMLRGVGRCRVAPSIDQSTARDPPGRQDLETMATTPDMRKANPSARQFRCNVSIQGTDEGAVREMSVSAHMPTIDPTMPPLTAMTGFRAVVAESTGRAALPAQPAPRSPARARRREQAEGWRR